MGRRSAGGRRVRSRGRRGGAGGKELVRVGVGGRVLHEIVRHVVVVGVLL